MHMQEFLFLFFLNLFFHFSVRFLDVIFPKICFGKKKVPPYISSSFVTHFNNFSYPLCTKTLLAFAPPVVAAANVRSNNNKNILHQHKWYHFLNPILTSKTPTIFSKTRPSLSFFTTTNSSKPQLPNPKP